MLITFDCFPETMTPNRLSALLSQLGPYGTQQVERTEEKGKAYFTLSPKGIQEKATISSDYREHIGTYGSSPARSTSSLNKAVGTGDEDAVTFVREIFSSENKDVLRELFTSKSISKESYPLFFDLAQQENNAELTAVLLEYKAALE